MRRALAVCAMLLAAPAAAAADDRPDPLIEILQVEPAVAVMRAEGVRQGAELDADMLGGTGGAFWARRVAAIYDSARMTGALADALEAGLSPAQRAAVIGFFDTPRGQRILTMETAARAAMADPAVEAAADAARDRIEGTGDPVLARVEAFIAANDLIELNLRGALWAQAAFLRGLVEGGAMSMDPDEILARVLMDREAVRADTSDWLRSFLLMAYRPLDPDDLDAYVAFSETEAGQALNRAFFAGFDTMFEAISLDLGRAMAEAMDARDL